MKRILVFAALALFTACNSDKTENKEPAKNESEPMAPMINSPYEIGYSSKFVIGDPKNAETTLSLWKDWDNGDLSVSRSKFADSVELYLADGTMMIGKTDSILKNVQQYRNNYIKSENRVDAIMAVKSTDKDQNWACIWGMEKMTDKKGKTDSSYLQETWRFNKDGKANLLYQFKAKPAVPKK